MSALLTVQGLEKRYGTRRVLDGASFALHARDRVGMIGANGAGKSTLLKMLARQTPVQGGSLRVLGLTYEDAEEELKNRVGYVPQEPVYYPDKRVEWIARFAAPYFARWDGAGFYALLDEFKRAK